MAVPPLYSINLGGLALHIVFFPDPANSGDAGRQAERSKKCLIFIHFFHYTFYKRDIFLISIIFLKMISAMGRVYGEQAPQTYNFSYSIN